MISRKLEIETVGRTDRGRVREQNEDALFVPCMSAVPLVIVADGMGGYRGGEIASRIGVNTAVSMVEAGAESDVPPEGVLVRAIQAANEAVLEYAQTHEFYQGMGTTLTAALLDGYCWILGHVGDSRCYLFSKDGLVQVTQDHSYVQELILAGKITAEEGLHHPMRNVITRAVGNSEQLDVDILRVCVEPGDILLLCSDGLTRHVSDFELGHVLQSGQTLKDMAAQLVNTANEAGGADNITLVLARIV